MRRTAATILIGVGSVVLGGPDPAFAVSLTEELRRIVEENPQLKAEDERVAAEDARVDEAFSGFLPRVEVRGDIGRERTDDRTRRRVQGTDARFTRKRTALTITQNLYDGRRRVATYDAAKNRREAAEATRLTTLQDVLFQGTTAYLNVLRQKQLLDITLENEASIQRQLELEDERVARGAGIAVDVLLAKSRLQQAKERRVAIEGLLVEAASTYKQVFGAEPPLGLLETVRPPSDIEPADLEEALGTAYENNPNISRIESLIAEARERTTAARSGYYPSFDFVTEGKVEEDFDAKSGLKKQLSVYVRGRWEFFNGFQTRSQVAAATRERAALDNESSQIDRQIEEQVRIAWERLQNGRQRVALLENAVAIAAEVFEGRKRLRAAGRETALNVLDAETEVFLARINLVSADFDSRIAFYQLLLAMGVLTPTTLGIY